MKRVYGSLGLITLCWLIGSCGGDGPIAPPTPTTAVVVLSATTGTLVPAATIQLSATAKDQSGQALPRSFSWSSSDVAKATVSSSGMVSGVAAGTATITAAVDGKSATATLTVLDGGVVSNAGATLSVLSGQVQIVVPADALSSPTNLSVVPSTAYANDPRVVKDTPFDFGPTGTTFAKPISVKIKYAPANLPQGTEEAALQLHLSTSQGWQAIEGSVVDVTAHTVTAPVSHFSVYAILTPLPVAAVTIRSPPGKPPLVVGDTVQLTATPTDSQGGTLTNRAITWATSDPATATVTPSGLVTAIGPGTAMVSATAGGVTSSISVTVTPVPVAAVAVTLTPQSVQVGQTSQASATLNDAAGHVLAGRAVTWSSSNMGVATVNTTGLVTAVSVGTATITATSEGMTGTASITVTAIPVASVNVTLSPNSITAVGTSQATAATLDANGATLTGRAVTWSSGNTAVATVSADGAVTAVAPGTASITATSEGKSGSASLTVTPAAVATIAVSPLNVTIVREGTQQLTATLEDAHHNVLSGRLIEWNTDAPEVATVSSTGLVSAIAAGVAHISAVSEGKIGTATVTVTPTPVASVAVSLASASLIAGQTTQATATTFDAGGNQLSGRTITWSSSNPSVATVSSTGLVTSLTGGNAQIIATSETKTGEATLTVAAAVASINVTLSPNSITAVGTSQASAVTLDGTGAVLNGRVVTWSSDNTAVATVSATTGAVTAVSVGTANIVATSEGKAGSALLTVTQAPVATVTVNPPSATVFQGETEQLTVTLRDARNNIVTRPVTWSSNNPVASVSQSGLVTAAAAMMGTATITATSEGQSGMSSITVTQVPVATISVALVPNTVNAGQNSQASATLRDAANNVLTGRTITWSSDAPSVATVASSGLVTTLAAGTANITSTSGGKSGSAPLTVLPVVASLTLSAPTTPTVLGQTQQLTAVPKDGGGNPLAGRTVNWVSSNPAILSVSSASSVSTSSGATVTLTAAGVGTAIITATSESAPSASTPVITVNPVPVATVTVNPSSATLVLGTNPTQQLVATLKDANNNPLTGRTVTWTSSNPSAATVDANGFVTALAGGSTTVTATSEGKSGTASITVTAPVATVAVSPSSATLPVGVTHQLTVTLKDINNNTLSGRVVAWSSSAPTVATVSSTGLVSAVAAGPATITATSESQSGSSAITVTPIPVASVSVALTATQIQVGQTTQATATTFDGTGGVLTGRVVTWSSGNTGIATVSPSGVVTAVSAGSTTIIATSEGKTGSAPLTVIPVPVGSVTVTPGSASVIAGNTQQLSAETRDANGVVVIDRLVTWSSSNTAVATVNGSGLVTAVSVGPATITATSEGKSGTSSITVVPVPVASVTVALSPNSITAVETSQATATTLDAHGGVLSGRAVSWSSSNTAIATVTQTGLVTAVAVGTASIVATSEGQTGSTTLTVTQAPVASVTVTPSPATVLQGATEQLIATLRDAHGNLLSRAVSWSSSNTAVATVSGSGLVNAVSVGGATITATSEGQSGSSTVTVSPVPVASVIVELGSSTITDAQTTQATATLRDANGIVLTGRTITWSSDNTGVATVSGSGLITPVAAGSTTIRATSGGQTGTAPLTVIPSVASITVAPSPADVVIGTTLALTAATKDANGNVLSGRSITWSSDAPSIATVSSSGLVSAVALGSATITATSEGKAGTSSITVVPVPVAFVFVSLASTSITAVQTTQATASTRDASGNVLTGRSISWSSGNAAIATVSSAGVVTAVAPGSVQIIAMSEGKTGSATLTVTPAPVATVTVSAPVTPMIVGGTQPLTATTRDANVNILTGRAITWVSSNTAVLTVSSSGSPTTVTAVGVGTATITATSESVSSAPTPTITVNPVPVATVTVALTPASITAIGTSQATATTRDANGAVLTGRVVTWSSDNTAVATVSATTGAVTAVSVGTANIIATSEGKTGSGVLTVTPTPVATVTVSPSSATLVLGITPTQQLTAVTKDANGNVLTGRTVTWSSNNTSAATVNTTGLVTAVAAGSATITAASEGQTGTSSIIVTLAPVTTVTLSSPTTPMVVSGTQVLTATPKDANGNTLSGRTVNWSSSNTAVLAVSTASSVSTASGATITITAAGTGTATITATSEAAPGATTAPITVNPVPVGTVTVSPASATLVLGITPTQQLTAVTKDAGGNVLTGRLVSWASSNTAAATVNGTGLVTAVGAGTAAITATSEGQSGTSSITVSLAPVASVTVSAPTTPMIVGATQQLTATARDANGNPLTGRTITWVSSNTAVLTVSASGSPATVTAVAVGTATITATSESVSSSPTLTITVNPVPVATVAVSPTNATLVLGITPTQQLTAVTKDANGNVLTGRSVIWSSSNTAAATVNGTGLVTAVGAGSTTITATSEGQSGTSAITVSLAPVATVTVSTPTTPMIVGQTQQLSATTKDANGNVLTGRAITWVSSNTAVLTVSGTGSPATVAAVGVGTATVTATSESASSSPTPTITVNPVPVATVTVSPGTANLVLGITPAQQLTAVTKDANGNVLTGRTVTWVSSNTAAATVSTSGLVTAVAAGGTTITATSEGQTGTSSITVTLAPVTTVTLSAPTTPMIVGGTQVLTATPKDANGVNLSGRTVNWSSSNTAVLTVSAASSVSSASGATVAITAAGPGTATITASSETAPNATTPVITVNPVPVATVTVTPATASLVLGITPTQQLTAVTKDANGNVLTGRSINWVSSNTAVAAVDANGLVTAVAAGGPVTITATSETKSGTSSITVSLAPVATVTVSPGTATLVLGITPTQQLTAVTKDANGNVLTGRTVTWSSSNGSVATVDANGLVTAVAAGGPVTITAMSETKTGTSSITVALAPVNTVTVTPASASLVLGITPTQQLSVVTKDANGNVLTGRTVTWTSSNPAAATVDGNGLVTAVGAGATTITATSETKTGSSAITVTLAPVATVTVSAPTTPMILGQTQQLTATTKDANGTVLIGRTITWVSSNSAVLTVSASGSPATVTAAGLGTATITATSESVSSSPTPTITVNPVPVATVTVSPTTASLVLGITPTQQLTAVTKDANDNVLTGRVVTWASSNTAAATVDANGLVTSVAAGTTTITATSEGQSGTSSITVSLAPVATVTVTPGTANLVLGITPTQQLTAVTKDANGTIVTGRTITWASSNTAAATVDGNGLVTAVGAGTTTVTATSEGQSGTSSITVAIAPVASVTVSAPTTPMVVGGTQQLTAVTKDANGNVLTGRTITWVSSSPSVLTVTASGSPATLTGVGVGTATITATSESVSSSPTPTITVNPAPVAVVTVSTPTTPMLLGGTQQLTATLKDANNHTLTGRTVSWVSSNTSVLMVSPASGTTGTTTVTSVGAGTATITATSESVSSSPTPTITVTSTIAATLLRVSTHNSRYFENAGGQIVYLTGSHTWSTLRDNGTVDPPPAFDYATYLDFLSNHNHNFFRLYAWEQDKWTAEIASDYWFSAGPYQRTGPGLALDGKPKSDLTQFNQAYFDRIRERVIDAGSRGIYVSVMLFNGWSVGMKSGSTQNNPWKGHPFNAANNINGIDGDTNGDGLGYESQTLGNSAITALQEAYVQKVIDAVGDLDNVLYEISNESETSSKDWQYHMIQFIRNYEATKPKQHPIGITPMWPGGLDSDLLASSADWISNTGNPDAPATATGAKVIITDTDHLCGICGDVAWVWKSFAKGQNPILMDGYDGAAIGLGASDYNISDPKWEDIRKNMGWARNYALRLDLAAAVPHGDLVNSESTGYCLAKPGSQYLVYIPSAGTVDMNLSAVTGTLNVEWLNPATGVITQAGTTTGGASVTLTAPFSGAAILFLY